MRPFSLKDEANAIIQILAGIRDDLDDEEDARVFMSIGIAIGRLQALAAGGVYVGPTGPAGAQGNMGLTGPTGPAEAREGPRSPTGPSGPRREA